MELAYLFYGRNTGGSTIQIIYICDNIYKPIKIPSWLIHFWWGTLRGVRVRKLNQPTFISEFKSH